MSDITRRQVNVNIHMITWNHGFCYHGSEEDRKDLNIIIVPYIDQSGGGIELRKCKLVTIIRIGSVIKNAAKTCFCS